MSHTFLKKNYKVYETIKSFKELFNNLRYQFKSLNLVIIIDSLFPENFIDLSKNFVEIFNEENIPFDFNIFFVHFEIHIPYRKKKTYTHQLSTYKKIYKNSKEEDQEITKIKNDFKKIGDEINNLKLDSKKKEKKMMEMQNEIDRINKIINNMEKKERLKKMKKKIRNEFKGTIKEEIEKIIKNKI